MVTALSSGVQCQVTEVVSALSSGIQCQVAEVVLVLSSGIQCQVTEVVSALSSGIQCQVAEVVLVLSSGIQCRGFDPRSDRHCPELFCTSCLEITTATVKHLLSQLQVPNELLCGTVSLYCKLAIHSWFRRHAAICTGYLIEMFQYFDMTSAFCLWEFTNCSFLSTLKQEYPRLLSSCLHSCSVSEYWRSFQL